MPDGAAPRHAFPPRLMRAPTAAYYLGMSESAFRATVAPAVPAFRTRGIVAWRREDLDAWVDRQPAGGGSLAEPVNEWHA